MSYYVSCLISFMKPFSPEIVKIVGFNGFLKIWDFQILPLNPPLGYKLSGVRVRVCEFWELMLNVLVVTLCSKLLVGSYCLQKPYFLLKIYLHITNIPTVWIDYKFIMFLWIYTLCEMVG